MEKVTIEKATFDLINKVDVTKKIEKKQGMSYLSWAWAWSEIKRLCPDANYVIKKFGEKNLPYIYDENTGYMVFTEVTIDGITHEMWLPVMDGANKAMKNTTYSYFVKGYVNGKQEKVEKFVEPATMFDINKTIMRCLTKNLAMFGLGLYIYAGEDLPEKEKVEKEPAKEVTPNEIGLWKEKLLACQSLGGCQVLWPTIPLAIQKNAEIIKAKEDLKKKFAEPFIQPAVVAA